MIEADKPVFAKALTDTLGLWGKKATAPEIEVWFRALKEYGIQQVQHAFDMHQKFSKFAPKPGEIVGRITGTNDRGEAKEDRGGYHRPPTCEAQGCPNPPAAYDPALCRFHIREPRERWDWITAEINAGNPDFDYPPTGIERNQAAFFTESGRYDDLRKMRRAVRSWVEGEVAAKRVKPNSWKPGSEAQREVALFLGRARHMKDYQPASIQDA